MLSATDIIHAIEGRRDEVRRLGVRSLMLFGSYARGEATPESDLDFLVEYEPGRGLFDDYVGLLQLLEDLFGKKVDLVKRHLVRDELKPYILGGEQLAAHL